MIASVRKMVNRIRRRDEMLQRSALEELTRPLTVAPQKPIRGLIYA
jgi:hypothetical protein